MILNILELFGAGFVLVSAMMLLLWLYSYLKKNAGIVDIGWAVGFVLAAWCYFVLGEGDFIKKFLVTLMATLWGVRLAWHLIQRFDPKVEDPRYAVIRVKMGKSRELKLLLLFLFQGFLVVILTTPFIFISVISSPEWHWLEPLGIIVWGIGLFGETLADHQLDCFKKDPDNQDKVCQAGLWNYSRHPNYFFELVVWVGFFIFALPTSHGEISIISPALMLFLLFNVSGIPLSEEQALKTKGQAYRDYQKTTSRFIPWPK